MSIHRQSLRELFLGEGTQQAAAQKVFARKPLAQKTLFPAAPGLEEWKPYRNGRGITSKKGKRGRSWLCAWPVTVGVAEVRLSQKQAGPIAAYRRRRPVAGWSTGGLPHDGDFLGSGLSTSFKSPEVHATG